MTKLTSTGEPGLSRSRVFKEVAEVLELVDSRGAGAVHNNIMYKIFQDGCRKPQRWRRRGGGGWRSSGGEGSSESLETLCNRNLYLI